MEEEFIYIALDYAFLDPDKLTTKIKQEDLSIPVIGVFEHVLDSLLEETKKDKHNDLSYNIETLKDDYNSCKYIENYSFGLYAYDEKTDEIIPLFNIPGQESRDYNKRSLSDFPNIIKKEYVGKNEREIIYLYPIINIGCG